MEARMRTPRQCRNHRCGAHRAGTLDRRAGAGDQDVEDDERQQQRHPGSEPETGQGQDRRREQGEQGDVLAAHRKQMGQPGAAEVVDRGGVDAVVLAENEAAQQRCLGRRVAVAERGCGAIADRVDRPREPHSLPPRQPDAAGMQHSRDAESLEVAALPGCRRTQGAPRTHLASDPEIGDGLRRLHQQVPGRCPTCTETVPSAR